MLLGKDGEQARLPDEVYRVLRHVVAVMCQGKAALIAPQNLLRTTQEAADLLGVSWPTLGKLVEDGAIPFDQPNRRRCVRLQDVLDYRASRHAARRGALDQPTEKTSALGLYQSSAADYAPALESARRRRARKRMSPTLSISDLACLGTRSGPFTRRQISSRPWT